MDIIQFPLQMNFGNTRPEEQHFAHVLMILEWNILPKMMQIIL